MCALGWSRLCGDGTDFFGKLKRLDFVRSNLFGPSPFPISRLVLGKWRLVPQGNESASKEEGKMRD